MPLDSDLTGFCSKEIYKQEVKCWRQSNLGKMIRTSDVTLIPKRCNIDNIIVSTEPDSAKDKRLCKASLTYREIASAL